MAQSSKLKAAYDRDGYIPALSVLTEEEAARHRLGLEAAEAEIGPLHYKAKMHLVMRQTYELVTHPTLLDAVESLIGPDILLYDCGYIIKEPGSEAHVSWHQDLTFWGLSDNAAEGQVTAWLALSPATAESGCMRMIPGSHNAGRYDHEVIRDETNVLYNGQTVKGVSEAEAVMCPLRPGEASFHHGWTLHASMPNHSTDRRIGLNVQFLSPAVRQTKHDKDTAMLVRGEDRYGHFAPDIPAESDWAPTATDRWRALNDLHVSTQTV